MRTLIVLAASLLLGAGIGATHNLTDTPDVPIFQTPAPTSPAVTEDDPGWNCRTQGEGGCGPGEFDAGATLDPTQVGYQNR